MMAAGQAKKFLVCVFIYLSIYLYQSDQAPNSMTIFYLSRINKMWEMRIFALTRSRTQPLRAPLLMRSLDWNRVRQKLEQHDNFCRFSNCIRQSQEHAKEVSYPLRLRQFGLATWHSHCSSSEKCRNNCDAVAIKLVSKSHQ